MSHWIADSANAATVLEEFLALQERKALRSSSLPTTTTSRPARTAGTRCPTVCSPENRTWREGTPFGATAVARQRAWQPCAILCMAVGGSLGVCCLAIVLAIPGILAVQDGRIAARQPVVPRDQSGQRINSGFPL